MSAFGLNRRVGTRAVWRPRLRGIKYHTKIIPADEDDG